MSGPPGKVCCDTKMGAFVKREKGDFAAKAQAVTGEQENRLETLPAPCQFRVKKSIIRIRSGTSF